MHCQVSAWLSKNKGVLDNYDCKKRYLLNKLRAHCVINIIMVNSTV